MSLKCARKWPLYVSLVLAVIALATVGTIGIVVKQILEGDERLRATAVALDALTVYVNKNHRWPSSWQDLSEVSIGAPSDWPSREAWVRQHVEIDFSVALDDIVKQESSQFSAVRPNGPSLGENERRIENLLEAAQKAVANQSPRE